MGYYFRLAPRVLLYTPSHKTTHTTAFVTPVVENWLERDCFVFFSQQYSARKPDASDHDSTDQVGVPICHGLCFSQHSKHAHLRHDCSKRWRLVQCMFLFVVCLFVFCCCSTSSSLSSSSSSSSFCAGVSLNNHSINLLLLLLLLVYD